MKDKIRLIWYIIFIIILILAIVNKFAYINKQDVNHQNENNITIDNTKIEIENDEGDDIDKAIKPISLGTFKLTAYCSCFKCCGKWSFNRPNGKVIGSTGEELKAGYSIAVDPNMIPYGTEVIINGQTYKAQDCGGVIKGNRIDVYMKNHKTALEFGVQYAEVFVLPE